MAPAAGEEIVDVALAAECTFGGATGYCGGTEPTADDRSLEVKGALKSAPVYSGNAFATSAGEKVVGGDGSGVAIDWRTASEITDAGTSRVSSSNCGPLAANPGPEAPEGDIVCERIVWITPPAESEKKCPAVDEPPPPFRGESSSPN